MKALLREMKAAADRARTHGAPHLASAERADFVVRSRRC